MKTQRTLGILWMALCGIPGILVLLDLLHKSSLTGVLSSARFLLAALICLLYLSGAAAGFFLLRGAPWSRRFIGVIAFLIAIATTAQVITYGLPILCGIVGAFSIVSLVWLFFPRHEPVA